MNVTYIIGNGFDINLGLRTGYKDFLQSYREAESKDDDIKKIKKEINDNLNLWSDFEKALGEYTGNVQTPEVMMKIFTDIIEHLNVYIKNETIRIQQGNEQTSKSLQEDFGKPEEYFERTEKEKIEQFYYAFNSNGVNMKIITLNYTTIIETLLNYEESLEFNSKYFGGKKIVSFDIYHLHHKIDDNILVGVNDEEQIKNEDFRKNLLLKENLIKPETNQMLGTGIDIDCEKIIRETHLFVLFGVSIGETDKRWWTLVAQRLCSSNSKLLFFEYDEKFDSPRRLGEYKRKIQEKFTRNLGLSTDEETSVHAKMHIAINKPIFHRIKKYIVLSPVDTGNVSFDYSDNDGKKVIGIGNKQFTTKWSKGSNTLVYAYSDPEDIEAVGLIKEFDDTTNITLTDVNFSSRVRSAQKGDAIIWKNKHGYYAITKIIDIKDSERGDKKDELTIEYIIQRI